MKNTLSARAVTVQHSVSEFSKRSFKFFFFFKCNYISDIDEAAQQTDLTRCAKITEQITEIYLL